MARGRLIKVKKNKHKLTDVEVNTTSLMDIITTLLFFLVVISSVNKALTLDATSLSQGKPSTDEKQVFTLTLNFVNAKQAEFWIGPSDKLKIANYDSYVKFMNRFFAGSLSKGYGKKLVSSSKTELMRRIEKALIRIKKSFPGETKIVLGFSDNVLYEDMISIIEGVRSLDAYFKPFVMVNQLGQKEKTRVLFPEVVISEWQEGPSS